jgi:hypothetical protein
LADRGVDLFGHGDVGDQPKRSPAVGEIGRHPLGFGRSVDDRDSRSLVKVPLGDCTPDP